MINAISTTALWSYISQGQKDLIQQGLYFLQDIKLHVPAQPIKDHSFLVFPFAKAYEGFLKQLFLDLRFIKQWQYEDDHIRIGKILSPHLQKQLRTKSVYRQLTLLTGSTELAELFWHTWKQGRNQIFHYYPHNLSAISLVQAEEIITKILDVMEKGVVVLRKHPAAIKKPHIIYPQGIARSKLIAKSTKSGIQYQYGQAKYVS